VTTPPQDLAARLGLLRCRGCRSLSPAAGAERYHRRWHFCCLLCYWEWLFSPRDE
jgi:hypothetical protein